MNKDFNTILKELREEKGLNQQELAKDLGVTRQTISNYENNRRIPNKEMFELIADYFNVDMNYLYGKSETKDIYEKLYELENIIPIRKSHKKIPILKDKISISSFESIFNEKATNENNKNSIENGDLNELIDADFYIRCSSGDEFKSIDKGDIIFIKKQSSVEDGDLALVEFQNEPVLRRVYKFGNIIQLRSENPSSPPITLNDKTNAKILGRAVYKLSAI